MGTSFVLALYFLQILTSCPNATGNIKKKLNILLEESIKLGYNINHSKQNINEFYNKCRLSKTCPKQDENIELYRKI